MCSGANEGRQGPLLLPSREETRQGPLLLPSREETRQGPLLLPSREETRQGPLLLPTREETREIEEGEAYEYPSVHQLLQVDIRWAKVCDRK